MGRAHEHDMLKGQAHEHMVMQSDPEPNDLKSRSGQPFRTLEFEQAKSKIVKIVENP